MSSLGHVYLKDTNIGNRKTYSEMNKKIEKEV
jgi:hypothetical protein